MITIGRKDRVDLPEFKLNDIEAKIDTGAYGCALHCRKVKVDTSGNKPLLSFQLLDPTHPEYQNKTYSTEHFSDKMVRNSGGISEHRYTIKTKIVIFGKSRVVEFSLTDRGKMKYPILLGRKFLTGKFTVDVALKDLSFKLKTSSFENSSTFPK
jgi:hypothetical protein